VSRPFSVGTMVVRKARSIWFGGTQVVLCDGRSERPQCQQFCRTTAWRAFGNRNRSQDKPSFCRDSRGQGVPGWNRIGI